MYIATQSFTTEKNLAYFEGTRISNFRYFLMKKKYKKYFKKNLVISTYPEKIENKGFVTVDQGTTINTIHIDSYPQTSTTIDTSVTNAIMISELESLINSTPTIVNDPIIPDNNQFQGFDGGTGGGGGAGGDWTPDPTPDYNVPDTSFDNSSYDNFSSNDSFSSDSSGFDSSF